MSGSVNLRKMKGLKIQLHIGNKCQIRTYKTLRARCLRDDILTLYLH